MRVIITYNDGTKDNLKKMTEVHYGYFPNKIAFESEKAGWGFTKDLEDIKEIEIFDN